MRRCKILKSKLKYSQCYVHLKCVRDDILCGVCTCKWNWSQFTTSRSTSTSMAAPELIVQFNSRAHCESSIRTVDPETRGKRKDDLRPNLAVFNPKNPFRKSTKFPASHKSHEGDQISNQYSQLSVRTITGWVVSSEYTVVSIKYVKYQSSSGNFFFFCLTPIYPWFRCLFTRHCPAEDSGLFWR